jgi:hypothetical protein
MKSSFYGKLLSVEWYSVTDVSGQHIGSILEGKGVQEQTTNLLRVTTQKIECVIYTAAEALSHPVHFVSRH